MLVLSVIMFVAWCSKRFLLGLFFLVWMSSNVCQCANYSKEIIRDVYKHIIYSVYTASNKSMWMLTDGCWYRWWCWDVITNWMVTSLISYIWCANKAAFWAIVRVWANNSLSTNSLLLSVDAITSVIFIFVWTVWCDIIAVF